MPPIEEPHVFETFPGGCYLVGDKWVDAEGKPTKSPEDRQAEAEAAKAKKAAPSTPSQGK
jgi:hypothetical protein